VSNSRKTRWTEAEITAASAEFLLSEVWTEAEAAAARAVVTRHLTDDLAAAGHQPGIIAAIEQTAMDLGTSYWAGIYRKLTRN
jgi:hypothetical protein